MLSHVPVPMPSNESKEIKIINKPKSIAPFSNEKREIHFKTFGSSFVFKYRNSPPINTKNNPIAIPTRLHIKTSENKILVVVFVYNFQNNHIGLIVFWDL